MSVIPAECSNQSYTEMCFFFFLLSWRILNYFLGEKEEKQLDMPNAASSLQDCWVIKTLLKMCLRILIRELVSPKPSVSILITKTLTRKGRHQQYFYLKDWSLPGFRKKGEETQDPVVNPTGVMPFQHHSAFSTCRDAATGSGGQLSCKSWTIPASSVQGPQALWRN